MILLPRSAGYIGTWFSLMTTLVAAAGVMVVALFCFFQRQRRALLPTITRLAPVTATRFFTLLPDTLLLDTIVPITHLDITCCGEY